MDEVVESALDRPGVEFFRLPAGPINLGEEGGRGLRIGGAGGVTGSRTVGIGFGGRVWMKMVLSAPTRARRFNGPAGLGVIHGAMWVGLTGRAGEVESGAMINGIMSGGSRIVSFGPVS